MFYYFHHVLKKLSFVRWLKLFRIAVSLVTFVWWLTYLADVYMASVSFRFSGRKACLMKNVGFCNRVCCPVSAGLVCKRRQFFHERVRLSVVSDGGVHPMGNEAQCFVEIFLGG